MICRLLLSLCLSLTVAASSAQEAWRDDLKNFQGIVPLSVPQGYRTLAGPEASRAPIGTVPGPAKVNVVGFVERDGLRFYLGDAANRQWLETGIEPEWIFAGGLEQLPPLPRLLKRGPGEDPDSGEEVMIEAYEETVAILPESRWPAAEVKADSFFPAALLAVGEDAGGNTTVDFQLFMNGNANAGRYPFAAPSFREMTNGAMGPVIRLYSNPQPTNFRLVISGQSTVLPLLQPGFVFLAGFAEGSLVRLSLGGDAWSESAAVSRLGAPVIRRDEKLVFGFSVAEITGGFGHLVVRPDHIAGADYTNYELISKMGAPFDEYSPPEYQSNWTVHIERDVTVTLLAPLYDGRGAPGMLELEGLSLDVAPLGPNPDNFSAEKFAAFRSNIPPQSDAAVFGDGWTSLLAGKLGEIPSGQRVPETDSSEN